MKKLITILFLILFYSCNTKNEIKKPKKLIDKEVMEKILYDLAILQGIKSSKPDIFAKNKVNPKTYIYQKYNIDSLQLVENNQYYASDIENYQEIFNNVVERISKEKIIIDTLNQREARATTKKLIEESAKKAKKMNNDKDNIIISG